MGKQNVKIPSYGTVVKNNGIYYRARVRNADGKDISLYARTPEELHEKVLEFKQLVEEEKTRWIDPTVKDYCGKWLRIQAARLRDTTMRDYEMKVRKYIVEPLGEMNMADVTADDVKIALIPALQKSKSVYSSVQMLYKLIFTAAVDSGIIDESPCINLSAKGGKPNKEKEALSNEQVHKLLSAIKGLPPYLFVMLGLYTGLRREEILALQWDCVFLTKRAPYLEVKRAWHSDHNRPVITEALKTPAARRVVPIPDALLKCLKEEKKKSKSDFVISNRDGGPLAYTQFVRMWQYIRVREAGTRTYTKYINGEKIKKTVNAVLGESDPHNKVAYTLDFDVTPHQLRHTYITNLLYAGVDPKTVQYLAGHENSRTTMDIYAKVKYNTPDKLQEAIIGVFAPDESNS